MTDHDQRFFDEAGARELDARTIASMSGDSYALMERAGVAAYRRLRANWPEARRLVACCGRGNNGGDGYVMATLARADGLEAIVVRGPLAGTSSADARRARDAFLAGGGAEQELTPGDTLPDADLVIDAMFGLGLSRAPAGIDAVLLAAINAHGRPVLCVDLPSGIEAGTGHAPGIAVRADMTVTFLGWKGGLLTGEGLVAAGRCVLETLADDTSIVHGVQANGVRLGERDLARTLPRRSLAAHKGDSGHVLVVGGEVGYGGAALLAGGAAARAGAGLVSVATHPDHATAMLAARPELMVRGIGKVEALDPLLARATVLALGPGLGQGPWGRLLLERSLASTLPRVIDADALNLLARGDLRAGANAVLTPHPGEAARLLGCATDEVQRDRYGCARAIALQHDAVVVLKGAGTVIAAPDGRLAVLPLAEPALAAGGTGDVLTGIVAALMAQGLDGWHAAAAGVTAHLLAARRASAGRPRGTLAQDVVE